MRLKRESLPVQCFEILPWLDEGSTKQPVSTVNINLYWLCISIYFPRDHFKACHVIRSRPIEKGVSVMWYGKTSKLLSVCFKVSFQLVSNDSLEQFRNFSFFLETVIGIGKWDCMPYFYSTPCDYAFITSLYPSEYQLICAHWFIIMVSPLEVRKSGILLLNSYCGLQWHQRVWSWCMD